MNSNSYEVKKTLEIGFIRSWLRHAQRIRRRQRLWRDRPGFSPVSCCLSHDVSKSPRFLSNFPAYLTQRVRYAGKTSTSSAGITSRRDTLQLVADPVGVCGTAWRVHSSFFPFLSFLLQKKRKKQKKHRPLVGVLPPSLGQLTIINGQDHSMQK
jgi:hypothetical protein